MAHRPHTVLILLFDLNKSIRVSSNIELRILLHTAKVHLIFDTHYILYFE